MQNKPIYVSTTTALILCGFTAYAQVSRSQITMPDAHADAINLSQSDALIPGWEKFEADNMELWLPESYDGGNLDEDIDVILSNVRRLGPEFTQIAQLVEQNRDLYLLWVFDSNLGTSNFLTNVVVISEPVISAVTLEIYLDAIESQFPPQFQVVGRDIVPLGQYQAGQLIVESMINGVAAKQILYIVKEGNRMWGITYSTGLEEFEQRLPSFRQSMDTFQIRS